MKSYNHLHASLPQAPGVRMTRVLSKLPQIRCGFSRPSPKNDARIKSFSFRISDSGAEILDLGYPNPRFGYPNSGFGVPKPWSSPQNYRFKSWISTTLRQNFDNTLTQLRHLTKLRQNIHRTWQHFNTTLTNDHNMLTTH